MPQAECVPMPAPGPTRPRLCLHNDKAAKRDRTRGYQRSYVCFHSFFHFVSRKYFSLLQVMTDRQPGRLQFFFCSLVLTRLRHALGTTASTSKIVTKAPQ